MMAAVLSVLGLAAAAPEDEVLFRSTFEAATSRPVKAPWKGREGRFTVKRDALRIVSERQNPVLRLDRSFEGDITVEARVRGADRCHWTGLVLRDVCWITVNNQFGTLSVVRRDGSAAKTLASVGPWKRYAYSPPDFRIAVSLAGGRICCALDGLTVIDVVDDRIPAAGGLAFVGGWGTDCRWSEIVVRRGQRLAPLPVTPKWGSDLVEVAAASVDRANGIYDDGERPVLTFTLRNKTPRPLDLRLRLRFRDYWERDLETNSRALRIEAGENVPGTFSPAPRARGCFKVALDVAEGDGPFAFVQDLASFSVIPQPPAGADPSAPFGGHFEQVNLDDHLAIGRRIGAKWVRCHDIIQWTWWMRVEPEKGRFVWQDENVKTVQRYGFNILGEFLHTPAWAADAPAGTNLTGSHYAYSVYPPRKLDDFSNYVFATVSRYKGSIRHWEVWNEPYYAGFWRGTPEAYAAVSAAAYQAAKRADPDCVVVGGGGNSLERFDWLDRAFKAGLAQHLDAFSLHAVLGPTTPDEVEAQDAALARLRGYLAARGVPVPIWNSETSFPSTSFLDQYRGARREPDRRYHFRHAAEDMVRLYAANAAAGIERTFYYFTKRLPDSEYRAHRVELNLLDVGGVLKPMGVSYATTARVLAAAKFEKRLVLRPSFSPLESPAGDGRAEGRGAVPSPYPLAERERDAVWCGIFQRGPDAVAVWWSLSGGRPGAGEWRGLRLPEKSVLIDLMGNERPAPAVLPVSREPRFLVCPATTATDLAARLH